jgi:hypothetical protein
LVLQSKNDQKLPDHAIRSNHLLPLSSPTNNPIEIMKSTILSLALVVSFISCKKNDDEQPPPPPASFTFAVNGGGTITADTKRMEYNASIDKWMITATKGTANTAGYYSIQIGTSNNTMGTYTVTSPSPSIGTNYIIVSDANDVGSFTSGSIVITAKTDSKVSGTFTATGGDHPAITSISGSFSNVPIY